MSYFKGIGRNTGSYAGRKLPLIGLIENKKHTIFNKYTVGSGVGASSIATRRLKNQRAKIKSCSPLEPIYPNLETDEFFEISDSNTTFNEDLQKQINAADLEVTYDFKDNTNSEVDGRSLELIANNHLNALLNDLTKISLSFSVISNVNPIYNAVDVLKINFDDFLSSEDYNIVFIEPIIVPESSNPEVSQYSTHTLLYNGNINNKPEFKYIMTITEFKPLQ